MPNGEKKVKRSVIPEESKESFLKWKEEHVQKMETDPEYKKDYEKKMKSISTFLGDSIED